MDRPPSRRFPTYASAACCWIVAHRPVAILVSKRGVVRHRARQRRHRTARTGIVWEPVRHSIDRRFELRQHTYLDFVLEDDLGGDAPTGNVENQLVVRVLSSCPSSSPQLTGQTTTASTPGVCASRSRDPPATSNKDDAAGGDEQGNEAGWRDPRRQYLATGFRRVGGDQRSSCRRRVQGPGGGRRRWGRERLLPLVARPVVGRVLPSTGLPLRSMGRVRRAGGWECPGG